MDNKRINSLRSIGWRLIVIDSGKRFKAIWARSSQYKAVAFGETVEQAIESAMNEIAFVNLLHDIERQKEKPGQM